MFRQEKIYTRDNIKQQNKVRIYKTLKDFGKLSIAELARKLNLSVPTVTKNLNELEETGLVEVSDVRNDTGGRSSRVYEIIATYRVAIGVSITLRHISVVVLDLYRNVIFQKRIRCKFVREEEYFRKLGEIVEEVVGLAQLKTEQILGVAIVIPALISQDRKKTCYNGVLQMEPEVELEEFAQFIPYPATLAHDCKSAAFAESIFHYELGDFFYFMVSDTVAGAPILNKKNYVGMDNRSGEIGHLRLSKNGKTCYCGKKGCMDTYIRTKELSSMTDCNLGIFFQKLDEGVPEIQEKWENYIQDLAMAISYIRLLYDCQIVIGGYLGAYLDKYLDEIRNYVAQEDPFQKDVDYVVPCKVKNEASALGGALYYIENFSEDL